MLPGKRHGRQAVSVSASELAQMGVCERLVVFEHRYGMRRSAEQLLTMKRGHRAHERFYRERHEGWVCGGRCVVRYFSYHVRRLWRVLIRCTVRWLQSAELRDGP